MNWQRAKVSGDKSGSPGPSVSGSSRRWRRRWPTGDHWTGRAQYFWVCSQSLGTVGHLRLTIPQLRDTGENKLIFVFLKKLINL